LKVRVFLFIERMTKKKRKGEEGKARGGADGGRSMRSVCTKFGNGRRGKKKRNAQKRTPYCSSLIEHVQFRRAGEEKRKGKGG